MQKLFAESLNTWALLQIRVCNIARKANDQAAIMAASFGDGGNKFF